MAERDETMTTTPPRRGPTTCTRRSPGRTGASVSRCFICKPLYRLLLVDPRCVCFRRCRCCCCLCRCRCRGSCCGGGGDGCSRYCFAAASCFLFPAMSTMLAALPYVSSPPPPSLSLPHSACVSDHDVLQPSAAELASRLQARAGSVGQPSGGRVRAAQTVVTSIMTSHACEVHGR